MMMQFLSDKDIVVFDLDDTLYKEIDYLFSAYHAIAESIRLDVAGEMLDTGIMSPKFLFLLKVLLYFYIFVERISD